MDASVLVNRSHPIMSIPHFVLLCALTISAVHVCAEEHQRSPEEQYQFDRKQCLSGHSDEDQKTCLKEAGAALEAKRNGQLNDVSTQYQKDATLRCQALSGDDREACLRRMQGEGTVSGSVGSGGVLRELVTPVPNQHADDMAPADSGK